MSQGPVAGDHIAVLLKGKWNSCIVQTVHSTGEDGIALKRPEYTVVYDDGMQVRDRLKLPWQQRSPKKPTTKKREHEEDCETMAKKYKALTTPSPTTPNYSFVQAAFRDNRHVYPTKGEHVRCATLAVAFSC